MPHSGYQALWLSVPCSVEGSVYISAVPSYKEGAVQEPI